MGDDRVPVPARRITTNNTAQDEPAGGPLQQLADLCATATSSVVLAAPFIKADVIDRLLSSVADDVDVTVVTRWHASEIAAQVSDLAVWPIIRARERSRLLLQQRLHAKYYRGDQACLLGSANLTATALAGPVAGNLELLVLLDAADSQLRGFEERLLSGCLRVDDGLYDRFCVFAEDLVPQENSVLDKALAVTVTSWYPQFRMPNELFRVYQGSHDYSNEVLDAARHDLLALAPPLGLERRAFEAVIGIALQGSDLIRELDAFLGTEERRFGEVRAWVSTYVSQQGDKDMAAQCLIRWIMAFLPDRYSYRRPGHSELLSLRKNQRAPAPSDGLSA